MRWAMSGVSTIFNFILQCNFELRSLLLECKHVFPLQLMFPLSLHTRMLMEEPRRSCAANQCCCCYSFSCGQNPTWVGRGLPPSTVLEYLVVQLVLQLAIQLFWQLVETTVQLVVEVETALDSTLSRTRAALDRVWDVLFQLPSPTQIGHKQFNTLNWAQKLIDSEWMWMLLNRSNHNSI